MSNGFLSQEEIDALLNGDGMDSNQTKDSEKAVNSDQEIEDKDISEDENRSTESTEPTELTDSEKDLLGEVGNISMGSASTALSTIVGRPVNIATPIVTISTLRKLRSTFTVPNIALDVKFTSGITGGNLLVMKNTDAAVIASLMMGGDGNVEGKLELSEIEISAVSEAMNQMIGSAATSMATMFSRQVNISPPQSKIWDDTTSSLSDSINENDEVVQVAFKMTIGDLIDSVIMQILPIETAKKIVSIMMGTEKDTKVPKVAKVQSEMEIPKVKQSYEDLKLNQSPNNTSEPAGPTNREQAEYYSKPIERPQPQVDVHKASFQQIGRAHV